MKLYNLGSLNIDYVYAVDHFVQAGETLSSMQMAVFPGGKGLNQSVALAKAGAPVLHGGLIGEDGLFLTQVLTDAGADTTRIQKVAGATGHAIIQVDRNGQNCILLFAGANQAIDEVYIRQFLQDACEGDILLLQNEISCLPAAFDLAHEKKMQIAFNPSPYHPELLQLPLSYVKWWFCNEIEAAALFGSQDPQNIGQAFLTRYPDSQLILTLGQQGSRFISAQKQLEQPIYKIAAVDTTAAGDTFTGFFLSAVANGDTPENALNVAAKASAIAVSRHGAASSIPTQNELSQFSFSR